MEQTLYSVSGWRGLNTRQACQLFCSVRDMRRRRLAQLLIHDLDITMKMDKSFPRSTCPKPAGLFKQQAQQSSSVQNKCVPPGFHFSAILFSVLSQLMMSYAHRIKQMVAREPPESRLRRPEESKIEAIRWWGLSFKGRTQSGPTK